jgi:hypothetical protein
MFNPWAVQAAKHREDLSPYLVHLTRDNTNHFPKTGMDASHTFNEIWNTRSIKARRVLCMHRDLIRQEPPDIQAKFRVACFTAAPLSQIKHFVGVYRRDYRFQVYGFIVKKETLLMKGASPALYINQYGGFSLRAWADRMYEMAKKTNFTGLLWQGIPFMNSVHRGNDFEWEREWKVRGNVTFSYRELAGVILPERIANKMWQRAEDNGVPVVSADWDWDRIEETLATRPKLKVKPKPRLLSKC